MGDFRFETSAWATRLEQLAKEIEAPENHLKQLIDNPDRLAAFSASGAGMFYDYSRQRVNDTVMESLFGLAQEAQATHHFDRMARGETVNVTEKRSALHMAARSFSNTPLMVDGSDARAELSAVREKIRDFSKAVHDEKFVCRTGEPFDQVVVVGIGGSYLGTEFVARALEAFANKGMRLDFLSNVDIHNFGAIWSRITPQRTLWIVISKSYTTAETMANEDLIRRYLKGDGLDPARHIVTVTSKGSPGDQEGGAIATFHMFDYIGGRYSVTSAVGGVPLSLYLGYDAFERFLKGAEAMDEHALKAPPSENLPLIAALLTIWNTSFLGYAQSAIIPYAAPLAKLAPHVQQLNMESNGKSVDARGRFLKRPAGTVIFGEPGTNAQHSFFQLAHQGPAFPVEFIGVVKPQYDMDEGLCKGVTHHQELWANMLAQATALATGKENENPAKWFSGNRPSSMIVLADLEPENIGRLLSFYEAKTIFEAFIWGINPFDQFGVELGKVNAGTLRQAMAARNADPGYDFAAVDPINRHYLTLLHRGQLP